MTQVYPPVPANCPLMPVGESTVGVSHDPHSRRCDLRHHTDRTGLTGDSRALERLQSWSPRRRPTTLEESRTVSIYNTSQGLQGGKWLQGERTTQRGRGMKKSIGYDETQPSQEVLC